MKPTLTICMQRLATAALVFNLGVAGIYAQQRPVKMKSSGTNVATTINLQAGTVTDEELLAGNGTLTQLLPSLPALAPAQISFIFQL